MRPRLDRSISNGDAMLRSYLFGSRGFHARPKMVSRLKVAKHGLARPGCVACSRSFCIVDRRLSSTGRRSASEATTEFLPEDVPAGTRAMV